MSEGFSTDTYRPISISISGVVGCRICDGLRRLLHWFSLVAGIVEHGSWTMHATGLARKC
jgi:hypothetical protein